MVASRCRKTVMYFVVYPSSTSSVSWVEYVERSRAEMAKILWCRVARKTPVGRIAGMCHVACRQLPAKWPDQSGVTGIVEAAVSWTEVSAR